MKANINLEIGKEDLNYELSNLVSEIASEEIEKMVKAKAAALVEQEIKRIIAPIVDSYLENALVGRSYGYHSSDPSRRPVDDYIKSILIKYLDEPCYLYSKTSSKLSERYRPSSSGGTSTTRAEYWIQDKTRRFVDEELFVKMENKIKETVSAVTPSEDEIQEIIKREIKEKFI